MPCFWHVLCRVCGLNWKDIMAGGQGLFQDGFRSKLACTGDAKELSGMLLCGSHAIAWLGSKLQALSTQLCSPCTPSSIQLRTVINFSSELHFRCS